MGKVSENIRRVAGMNLMTQCDLAAATGVSKQAINNIFMGRSEPSLKTLRTFAEVFGVSASDLLSDTCVLTAAEKYMERVNANGESS